VGGVVSSWLERSSPNRAVRVQALARDTMLCFWARHFTLTVPLSTQMFRGVPANLMLEVTLRWTNIPSRGSRNTPSRIRDKLRPDGPLGSYAEFTYHTFCNSHIARTLVYHSSFCDIFFSFCNNFIFTFNSYNFQASYLPSTVHTLHPLNGP